MKKFLPFVFVLLFLSTIRAQDATATAAWQVTKYDILATLPTAPNERNLTATATLNLRNIGRGAGATVTLRINQKAEIISTKANSAPANFRKSLEDKLGSLQRFSITLPASVEPNGTTVVTVEYRLPVVENSGLTAISPVGSQFLPLAVWYPTIGNPYAPRGADFAPFQLKVTAANGATVISSGASDDKKLNGQPFFVTGNWEIIEPLGQRVVDTCCGIYAYLPKGASANEKERGYELMRFADSARESLRKLLGSDDHTQIKLVAVNRGAGFSDGGTILLDEAAFRRQKIDQATALTIAEAIAKIHLGNSIMVRGEGYGAIREGLARFVATKIIESQFGKDAGEIERLRQRTSYAAVAKIDAPLSQTSPADKTYFAAAANKGAMIWRLVAREMGEVKFFAAVRTNLENAKSDGLTLAALRASLAQTGGEKVTAILDYGFDQPTDTDLLVGLPVLRGAETVSAVRNQGSLPVSVNVSAVTETGEKLNSNLNIAAKNFGEVIFKTTAKIVRVEIDPEKFYPQIDYSNDIKPLDINDNDLSLAIAAKFNQQKFAEAETVARKVLTIQPKFSDARVWLARALLEQNRPEDAEKEFNAALSETLPTAKTLAWANIGLGEIAFKRKQPEVSRFFDLAVHADAEYASNLAARQGRLKSEAAPVVDETAKTFFAAFDKAVLTGRKAEVDNLVMNGEMVSFAARLSANQPEIWQTKVLRTETLDANRMAVEVALNAKLINKESSNGTALFFLAKTANGWRLAGVDLFEVR